MPYTPPPFPKPESSPPNTWLPRSTHTPSWSNKKSTPPDVTETHPPWFNENTDENPEKFNENPENENVQRYSGQDDDDQSDDILDIPLSYTDRNSMALIGFICSICGIVFIPICILGLIFSIIGIRRSNRLGLPYRGLAIVGTVIPILEITAISVVAAILLYNTGSTY